MRKTARMTGAVAVATVFALSLTGCGGSDDDGGDKAEPKPSQSESQDKGGADDPLDETTAKGMEGIWYTTAGEKSVGLSVYKGKISVTYEGETCTGEVLKASSQVDMKCAKGGTDRAKGTVKNADGKTLTIAWDGGGDETFQRLKGDPGEMPDLSDLPTKAP